MSEKMTELGMIEELRKENSALKKENGEFRREIGVLRSKHCCLGFNLDKEEKILY